MNPSSMSRFITFVNLARELRQIADSEASWETKYEMVFSDEGIGMIKRLDVHVEWRNPDGGYEEDVLAYVRAVNDKADDVAAALGIVPHG